MATKTSSNKKGQHTDDLEKVFKDTLKDIFWAEKHLAKALTKNAKAADSEELKAAFEKHKEETEDQISKLEKAFEELGMRAAGKKCEAMAGLLEEGKEHIEEFEKGPARDAALIVGAQKIEHYEIAAYGSLRAFARSLGYGKCEKIFDDILYQESATDEKLTEIAEVVNERACAPEEATA